MQYSSRSISYLQVEIPSDDEDDEVITITDDAYKPLSLEKMITLIAVLVEKSRGEDKQLHISDKDYSAIIGGKVSTVKVILFYTLLFVCFVGGFYSIFMSFLSWKIYTQRKTSYNHMTDFVAFFSRNTFLVTHLINDI